MKRFATLMLIGFCVTLCASCDLMTLGPEYVEKPENCGKVVRNYVFNGYNDSTLVEQEVVCWKIPGGWAWEYSIKTVEPDETKEDRVDVLENR